MREVPVGVCRGCARNTDRVHEVVPKKSIALCLECQKAWSESPDKKRADHYVKIADEKMAGTDTSKALVIEGIIGRAFQDFLYQLQRDRTNHGKQVGA